MTKVTTHHLAEASSQVVCYIKVNCWTAEKHLDGGDHYDNDDGDDHDHDDSDVRMVVMLVSW